LLCLHRIHAEGQCQPRWVERPTCLQPQLTFVAVHVVRVALSIENGVSMVHNINSSAVQLGDGQIKDVKFSDSVLLVLWESKGKSQLAHISGG
jgi:hypothetical protein